MDIGFMFAMVVALTNIIVNVCKSVLPIKNPKVLVVSTAIALSLIGGVFFGVYSNISGLYLWAADIVISCAGGFVSAYVAMYGYDEGYQDILQLINRFVDYVFGSKTFGGGVE